MDTARRIRRAREARGLTQVQLAALVGCDPITVSRAERGVTHSLTTLEKLGAALGLELKCALVERHPRHSERAARANTRAA